MKRLLTVFAISLALGMSASAANVQNSIAAISAFKCSMWADVTGDLKEAQRLFDYGVKAGRQFLQDAEDGKFPTEEYTNTVPMVWSLNRGGPTVDFVLGKVYSKVADDAYDEVAKVNASGIVSLNTEDWTSSKDILKSRAQTKYRNGNCKLIGM
ncbi:hypothetical protein [Phyllobacterium sp. SB3]|uniref:hypothetical protein n=1 Tax=Phyllobacterium sp. SB3 TaxID=3156073 RepID=UPI0032AEC34A